MSSDESHGISYAKGFTMETLENGTYIVVNNPWKENDTLATYFLTKKNYSTEDHKNTNFIIQIPVQNVVSLSSTFLGMFSLLGEEDRIIAASEARLIYDSLLYDRYIQGDLKDLGDAFHLNVEAIIGLRTGLVMKYIYGAKENADRKLIDAGIPVAYNLEFMESHPLGRAEWIKFVAAFVDKNIQADSIFNKIEGNYLKYSSLVKDIVDKPTVLDGSSYKGIWYAAGGQSFPARLYSDAGADYFWKSDSGTGSIPLSLEVIIENQADADFWIGPSSGSRAELLKIESRYALLKAFRNGNVYFFGKRVNPERGYDYYESGVVQPDILLHDLIWAFHPEVLDKSYIPVYLEKIK